jgi:hypothetical protein
MHVPKAINFKGPSPAEGNQIISCSTDAFYHLLYFFLLLILTNIWERGRRLLSSLLGVEIWSHIKAQVAISSIKKRAATENVRHTCAQEPSHAFRTTLCIYIRSAAALSKCAAHQLDEQHLPVFVSAAACSGKGVCLSVAPTQGAVKTAAEKCSWCTFVFRMQWRPQWGISRVFSHTSTHMQLSMIHHFRCRFP